MLGIGASSSAAYTLRKHYTKNLLPFECKFDRGGIDPAPIIAQVEAGSKKKSNKTASVPSPGRFQLGGTVHEPRGLFIITKHATWFMNCLSPVWCPA